MKDYFVSFTVLAALLTSYSLLVFTTPKPTHLNHDTPMASAMSADQDKPDVQPGAEEKFELRR